MRSKWQACALAAFSVTGVGISGASGCGGTLDVVGGGANGDGGNDARPGPTPDGAVPEGSTPDGGQEWAWRLTEKIRGGDIQLNDGFGSATAMTDTHLFAAAKARDGITGRTGAAIYIAEQRKGREWWVRERVFVEPETNITAIAAHGDVALMGTITQNGGAVRTIMRARGLWRLGGSLPVAWTENARISYDGNRVLVVNRGSITILAGGPDTWHEELRAPLTGWPDDVRLDGDRALIVSSNDSVSRSVAHFFDRGANGWSEGPSLELPKRSSFPSSAGGLVSTELSGDGLVSLEPSSYCGAVKAYRRAANGTWSFAQDLSIAEANKPWCAYSLAKDGANIVVSKRWSVSGSPDSGSSFARFEWKEGSWTNTWNLPVPTAEHDFHRRAGHPAPMALGNNVFVGEPYASNAFAPQGQVTVFEYPPSPSFLPWRFSPKGDAFFGQCVRTNGAQLLVAASRTANVFDLRAGGLVSPAVVLTPPYEGEDGVPAVIDAAVLSDGSIALAVPSYPSGAPVPVLHIYERSNEGAYGAPVRISLQDVYAGAPPYQVLASEGNDLVTAFATLEGTSSEKDVLVTMQRKPSGWTRTGVFQIPNDDPACALDNSFSERSTLALSQGRLLWQPSSCGSKSVRMYEHDNDGSWIERAALAPTLGAEWGTDARIMATSWDGARAALLVKSASMRGVFVFAWQQDRWVEQARIPLTKEGPDDRYNIAISGDRLALAQANGQGFVRLYAHDNGTWRDTGTLAPSGGPPTPGFGRSMAFGKDELFVGSWRDGFSPEDLQGAAYRFAR